MYDFLIVGAGLSGSVFAREATRLGKRCLVIDQREHIGGNCYTKQHDGINVHVYGPHIFHTSDEKIWKYVNQFAKFNHYINRPKVFYRNKYYSFPINLMTLSQLWPDVEPTPKIAKRELDRVTERYKKEFPNPQNMEQWALANVGSEIYETFIKGYTTKQWMRPPSQLPATILKRVPVRLTWDDNYYNDRFQGIPIGGYTKIFENMLDGIEVKLGVDFFNDRQALEKMSKKIVYTGQIDKLFDCVHGELEYRTLKFEHCWNEIGDSQGTAVINYTDTNVPWTRKIEHKHFDLLESDKSVVSFELPVEWTKDSIPYYPINDASNSQLYAKYREMIDENRYIVTGRLGRYAYFDMHQAIGASLSLVEKQIR